MGHAGTVNFSITTDLNLDSCNSASDGTRIRYIL